jgi:tetratricopeptide (TPR) repeat protein
MFRAAFIAALLLAAPPVPDAPGPSYTHDDPAAIAPPIERRADRRDLMRIEQRLAQQVRAQPEHIGLRATLGYVQALRGKDREAAASYAGALARAADDAELRRHVLWSRGWALIDLGEPHAALAAWREAERLHGGAPYWVPYTYAIGLWAAGEHGAALRWYAAAVRDYPAEWGTRQAMERSTAAWQPKERALAKAVFAAWENSVVGHRH